MVDDDDDVLATARGVCDKGDPVPQRESTHHTSTPPPRLTSSSARGVLEIGVGEACDKLRPQTAGIMRLRSATMSAVLLMVHCHGLTTKPNGGTTGARGEPPDKDRVPPSHTLADCQRRYPELLARVDRELVPWRASGITASMMERRVNCPANLDKQPGKTLNDRISKYGHSSKQWWHPEYANFEGIYASFIRPAKANAAEFTRIEQAFYCHAGRLSGLAKMLKSVERFFGHELRNVSFVVSCADTLPVFSEWDATAEVPTLAPYLVAYRRQKDDHAVAIPDWTFYLWQDMVMFQSKKHVYGKPDDKTQQVDDHMRNIRTAAQNISWADRIPKLLFRGQTKPVRDEANRVGAKHRDTMDIVIDPGKMGRTTQIVSHTDHCKWKYLLQLQGHGASARLKYLLACNSTVILPHEAGGTHASRHNQFEEFFYHRLVDGENIIRVEDVSKLPELMEQLVHGGPEQDDRARRIAAAGAAFAKKEITADSARCYWATVLKGLGELQERGGYSAATPPANWRTRPNSPNWNRGRDRNSPGGRPCCCACKQGHC